MINKKQAIEVLNAGLATGADYAEIYVEDVFSTGVALDNGRVESASKNRSYGAGVRLLKGYQSVYGYTSIVTKESLLKIAQDLANSFSGERVLTIEKLKTKKAKNIHTHEIPLSTVPFEDKINYLKRADKVLSEYDPRIIRRQAAFSTTKKDIHIFSSKGYEYVDSKERGRVAVMALAFEDGKIETGFNGPGASAGFEWFLNEINIEEIAKNTAKDAITMLGAKECPSGIMPVVIGNGFGGVIFHEACGHSLEGTSVSKKLSVFSDSLGKQIASPIVTAIDDGTIPNGWGSNNIDDEGNPTEKTVLIKDGVCTSFLLDDFTGRRIGMKGNGACRRESYKYEPTSRMSNTYIAPGNSTPEEIIASTKLGLYAASLGGGSVNPATGEFNFAANVAYIIRDGKICEPVRGATLIGSGKDILFNIDMVGNDLKRAQGVCGSASGGVPVDVGQPTIRVSQIAVGGNGGELK